MLIVRTPFNLFNWALYYMSSITLLYALRVRVGVFAFNGVSFLSYRCPYYIR